MSEDWQIKRERLLKEGYDPLFISICDKYIKELDLEIEFLERKRKSNPFCMLRDLFNP